VGNRFLTLLTGWAFSEIGSLGGVNLRWAFTGGGSTPKLSRLKWLAVVVVLLVLPLLGCDAPQNACACPAELPQVRGLVISFFNFARSGSDVNVDFQTSNKTSTQQRFFWDQFVLRGPQDGHARYRPPGGEPYEVISAGKSYASIVFQFPTFIPGEYVISYAGVWLEGKPL
jgi:hypothetical protein